MSAAFLGAYHFEGDPATLLAAYERLMRGLPPDAIEVHVCVVGEKGITILDACPSRVDFEAFSAGPDFRGALAAAGLPVPRVESLGAVHVARVREAERHG